jgi:hypothetical protein
MSFPSLASEAVKTPIGSTSIADLQYVQLHGVWYRVPRAWIRISASDPNTALDLNLTKSRLNIDTPGPDYSIGLGLMPNAVTYPATGESIPVRPTCDYSGITVGPAQPDGLQRITSDHNPDSRRYIVQLDGQCVGIDSNNMWYIIHFSHAGEHWQAFCMSTARSDWKPILAAIEAALDQWKVRPHETNGK